MSCLFISLTYFHILQFMCNKSYMISVPQSPSALPVFGSYLTTAGDILVSHSYSLRPTFETIVS